MVKLLLFKKLFSPFTLVIFFGMTTAVLSLTTGYYKKRYEATRKELENIKKELDLTKIKYAECSEGMNKIKVDYTKKLKEFIQNYKTRSHFDRLKEIPPERGDKDECEQIKDMLDIYRNIEQSGYFNNKSNRSVLTHHDGNEN